jgi:two-component system, sensor histidine kinase PdtaS
LCVSQEFCLGEATVVVSTDRVILPNADGGTAREPSDDMFMRTIMDASIDCIKVIELDGVLSYMNANGMCAMEIDDFGAVCGTQWCDFWPIDEQQRIATAVVAAQAGQASRFEAFCPTAKGSGRWWDVSVAPVRDPAGQVVRIISISRDITLRVDNERSLRQALIDKDVLSREVDHRVKNSLALIASLLATQARSSTSGEARAALAQATSRLSSITRIHDHLYKSADLATVEFGSYLENLCRDIAETAGHADRLLDIAADRIDLPVDRAIPLGLIATELMTNAFKHAVVEAGQPAIRIGLAVSAASLVLSVRDNGGGLPEGFKVDQGRGLGVRIISTLIRQLDGAIVAENADGGAKFTITVPRQPVASDQAERTTA